MSSDFYDSPHAHEESFDQTELSAGTEYGSQFAVVRDRRWLGFVGLDVAPGLGVPLEGTGGRVSDTGRAE